LRGLPKHADPLLPWNYGTPTDRISNILQFHATTPQS
jgi:hypothetical protein